MIFSKPIVPRPCRQDCILILDIEDNSSQNLDINVKASQKPRSHAVKELLKLNQRYRVSEKRKRDQIWNQTSKSENIISVRITTVQRLCIIRARIILQPMQDVLRRKWTLNRYYSLMQIFRFGSP